MKENNSFSLSVAMCTFNGGKYLKEQLNSIVKQTQLPNELVVCDDGSTDNTLEILEKYQNIVPFLVRIHFNKSRLGAAKNFEKAISLCKGDIIVLSDQDDIWLPYRLERILQIFKNNLMIGYVFSDAIIVNEKLQHYGYTMWERVSFNLRQREQFKKGRQLEVLLKHNVVTGATMAFRKELRKWIFPIPEQWMHDAWIALLVSSAKIEGALIEEALIKYRQHSNQLIGGEKVIFIEQLKKTHNTNSDSYEIIIKKIEDVLNRLIKISKLEKDNKRLLESKITHLQARQWIHNNSRWKRLSRVFIELLKGRYHRFSNGWKSVIKDLCL